MSKKLSTLLALLVIVSMVLTACGATAEPTKEVVTEPTAEVVEPTAVPEVVEPTAVPEVVDAATKPLKIYAVQHAQCSFDAFWCTVEAGIKQAAADMGVEVTLLAPDKFDLEKTAQLIEQAVSAKPDGLALTVTDADLFRAPIQKALDAGIPVVAYNAGKGPVLDDIAYLTYLGQDEYQGGYQGGQRLAADGGT